MSGRAERRRGISLQLAGLLALILVAAAIGWWGWSRPPGRSAPPSPRSAGEVAPPPPSGEGASPPPQTEFQQGRLTGWYRGQKQWELQAVQVAEDGVHTRLEQVREGVLYRAGQPYLGFQSGTGVWDQSTGDLDLSGGVQVTYQGHPVFQTEQLQWFASTSRLVVPGRVVLDWQGRHLQANRLEGDLNRQLLTATGQVVLEEQGQRLAADRVELDLANGEIQAQGPARLELGL